jgi:hypothetical protein
MSTEKCGQSVYTLVFGLPPSLKDWRAMIAYVVKGLLFALSTVVSLDAADNLAYRNTAPGVGYVGSRMCSGCHAKIYQDYVTTAMGRSMSLTTSTAHLENVPGATSIFSAGLNRHFEVSKQGSALFQTEYELDTEGHEVFRTTHKLDYVIGSGVNGYGYIVRRGDYLFQAPLSYYPHKKTWGLSPGYESADYGFNRPIASACISCHSGRPQAVDDRPGLFGDPPFRELAIGCENCHGPGALHATEREKRSPVAEGIDQTIVNPARLPARLAEDICMNCHQGSETRILQPGKDRFSFRPGTPLSETLAILRIPLNRHDLAQGDLLEHHLSMQLSRCYQSSGETLGCLTCHQIHSMPSPAEAVAYYRSKCLTCHAVTSCKLPMPLRLERADDCVVCHMPKRSVEILPHAALTNHRIIARPEQPLGQAAFTKGTSDLPDLIYFNRPRETNRALLPPIMLLQAYGELMRKEPEYQQRYVEVLEQLSHTAPLHPLVEASLGRKLLQSGIASNVDAIRHLTRAIDLGFNGSTVYEDLAEALVRAGREAEAVEPLEHGIELAPFTPVLYKSLSLRYINLKRYAEAQRTLERYVELFPEDDFVRGLLLKVKTLAPSSGR